MYKSEFFEKENQKTVGKKMLKNLWKIGPNEKFKKIINCLKNIA